MKSRTGNLWLSFFMILAMFSCTPESKPIAYGEDKCEFCRMSIVDQRFGCEIVTSKGKALKFDAVECMVNYIDENVEDETTVKLILTNTYDAPGQLSDATKCLYLKSKNMPSPMGKYINPFLSSSEVKKAQEQNSGEILNWEELRGDFADSQ